MAGSLRDDLRNLPDRRGPVYVYVAYAEDGAIGRFKLNSASGALQARPEAAAGKLVMPMAPSPDRQFLYASIRSQPYGVICYQIERPDGALTQLGFTALPESMAYISTDQAGRFLLGASFGGDLVSVSPIDARGLVGEALHVLKTGRHPHSILSDPSNRFVYAAILGADRVMQWSLDARTGALRPIGDGFAAAPEGSGPRHLAFSPDSRFLYVLNERLGSVTTYSIEANTGALTQSHYVEGVPPSYNLAPGVIRPPLGQPEAADDTARIWAADIHVTPNGRFVYLSERGSNSISCLKANAATGELVLACNLVVEKQPRGFNIDPSGRFLVVAGEKSDCIGVYAIDAETGALTLTQRAPGGRGANWVEIVDLGA